MVEKPKAGLKLSVTPDGLLRLTTSFPMIDFSRNDALAIARTMEKLAKTLPIAPTKPGTLILSPHTGWPVTGGSS